MKDLPINVLRTFVAIVERGGFTQAAAFLGMTQPTVSQQLKKLEELVGLPLLNRGQRQLELTTAGEKILDYARRILMLNDEAVSQPKKNGSHPLKLQQISEHERGGTWFMTAELLWLLLAVDPAVGNPTAAPMFRKAPNSQS